MKRPVLWLHVFQSISMLALIVTADLRYNPEQKAYTTLDRLEVR